LMLSDHYYSGNAIMRTIEKLVLATSLAVVAATAPALAADAQNGERLAHRWCESCHVVGAKQAGSGTDQAPPFATVAKRPNFDAGGLALFLLAPHPKMPDMSLTRTEAADLAAYIATLK